jgi:hypothetical protein
MKVWLKVNFEVEFSDDATEQLRRDVEMMTAQMTELLELRWEQSLKEVQKKYPQLKFRCGEPPEDWR